MFPFAAIPSTWFDVIAMTGKESVDFLQRISTNDVTGVSRGEVRPTLFVSDKGRIIDTVWVVPADDGVLLCVSRGMAPTIIPWLERYIIMEEITVADRSNELSVAMSSSLSDGSFPTTFHGIPVFLSIVPRTSETATASDNDFDIWRIAAGIPRSQQEMTEEFNPLELHLWPWISFTKGCYIGQEVIARLDTYNKIQRSLCHWESESVVGSGSPVMDETGNSIGRITSVYQEGNTSSGLAVLRIAFAEEGCTLTANGVRLTIDKNLYKEHHGTY